MAMTAGALAHLMHGMDLDLDLDHDLDLDLDHCDR